MISNKRFLLIFLGLFLLSFAVRALFFVGVRGLDAPMIGDMGCYHLRAVSLISGQGIQIPDETLLGGMNYSGRPPLISVLTAGIYSLVGAKQTAARWLFVTVSSLTSALVFILAYLVCRKEVLAGLCGLVWTLYPPSIYYSSEILTETNAAFFVVLCTITFVLACQSKHRWAFVCLTGLIWGLAPLNRSSFLLLPICVLCCQLLVWLFYRNLNSWNWKMWLCGLGFFLLTLTPWTARNYVIHGKIMPTTARLGYGAWVCNGTLEHPDIQAGMYYKNQEIIDSVNSHSDEVSRNEAGIKFAVDELKRNWRLLPKTVGFRAVNFWTFRPDPFDPHFTKNDIVMLIVWIPLLVLFILSLFRTDLTVYWPLWSPILYAFVMTLPFWGAPRFRYPVSALIVICGITVTLPLFISVYNKRLAKYRFCQRTGLNRLIQALFAE